MPDVTVRWIGDKDDHAFVAALLRQGFELHGAAVGPHDVDALRAARAGGLLVAVAKRDGLPAGKPPRPRAGFCYFSGVKGLPLLLLVLVAIGSYAMSLAPVVWVVISEIFPNRIRGAAMAVAVSSLWIACFLLTFSFPVLNKVLGTAGIFWLYAGICAAGFLFIKFKLPETK